MSEALNSSNGEDVLSSIRRLVSEDLRPAGSAAPRTAVAEGGKLLLTPALRVVSNEGAIASPPPIDAVVARVSAAVNQQADEWESETGDVPPGAGDAAPMIEDAEPGDWDDHKIAAYADPVIVLKTPEERAQEAAMAAEEVSAEAAAQADQPPGWAQSDGADEAEAPAPEDWAPEDWREAGGNQAEPDQAWADAAEAAVLQELGAASAEVRPEPPRALPEQGAASRYDLEDLDAAEDDLQLPVDEAMLREIVRDVLREELQGRLGERITRNIRKLVRAEIARVAATEELS